MIADLDPRDDTLPGEVLISPAVGALDAAGIERDSPVASEGLRERHLAECRFRGRVSKKIQLALPVPGAAAGHRA